MYGADTARGRLAIGHDLVLDEHGLFRGGGEAGLPGKLRDQVPVAIMSSGVETFRAERCVSPIGIKDVCAHCFPPKGALPHCWPVVGAGQPQVFDIVLV